LILSVIADDAAALEAGFDGVFREAAG